jgi:ABC-type antimicrobial peptide transport system permease subunit
MTENGVPYHKDISLSDILNNQIKQIPEIPETVGGIEPLLAVNMFSHFSTSDIVSWDEKSPDIESITLTNKDISEEYAKFYELRVIEGEMLSNNEDRQYVMLNESAVKAFGWHKPVGKSFTDKYKQRFIVKGVVKNIYNHTPTIPAKPCCLSRPAGVIGYSVLFKYEGEWKTCKDKIEQLMKKEYPSPPFFNTLSNAEEVYDSFLKSENTLLKLLTFISLICVIICVFGFVSLVSLTCEERRKEIAIRKIHGATIKDILDNFFKEYLFLLIIGAVIAFPLGYYAMRRWLEEYVVQTPISAWVYAVILLMLILSIILCVGWKVYKTSTENPAEVIKN